MHLDYYIPNKHWDMGDNANTSHHFVLLELYIIEKEELRLHAYVLEKEIIYLYD